MKIRSAIAAVMALAVIAGAGFAAAYIIRNRPLTVEVAQPENSVAIEVFGLGTVEAQIISSIGFEVGAALVELAADHGDSVKRDAVLARLDASEQQARVVRAKAIVQSSEAALARVQTLVDRQAAVLAQKDEVNRRQQDLVRKNVVSIERAQEAAMEFKVAQADNAVAAADVTVARAALETARADLLRETVLLEKYQLKAPFDAIVVERHRELGAAVKAGDPVFTLVDPATAWALAHVEESRAGSIAVGQPAVVRLRSRPGAPLAARVIRIGIESDRVSEERRVWVKCEECPPAFHLGEQAEVVITTAVLPEALLVPETAVSGFDGVKGSIWAVENGKARRMTLAFSQRTLDGRLALADPVAEGIAIITSPITGLSEGRSVSPARDSVP